MFYRHIGKKIEELRRRKKLTQARLADIVSLSRTSIVNIEKGRQKLLAHTLWEIAQALGAQPQDFFPGTENAVQELPKVTTKLSPAEAKWFDAIVTRGGKNGYS